MEDKSKKWIVSSLITFLTGFAAVFVLEIDQITLETLADGSAVGIIFAGLRAGVKAVLEHFLLSK